MSLVTAFNNQMSNFMNDLSYLFPNDKKFMIFEQKFEISASYIGFMGNTIVSNIQKL